VKRLLAVLLGGFGLRAVLRRRRRRAELESPAEQLRTKLAESRSAAPTAEALVDAEEAVLTGPEPAEEPPADVDERRASVHEQARRAMDELGGS
jgi:hypothetical protein